jgi:predicted transposase YdaD
LISKVIPPLITTNTKTKDHPNHLNQRTQRGNLLTLVIPKLGQQETNEEKLIYTMLQLYSIHSSSSIHFSLSLGSYWFGEGAREGEDAGKKGGGVSGREEHEQEEGERLMGEGRDF